MVARITLLAAAVLVITPAAVTMAMPSKIEASPAARSVEVDGPVIGFTQLENRIQVRLSPATNDAERNARQRVVIRSASGDQMTIPLKAGQTWASAELTTELARASALTISVD